MSFPFTRAHFRIFRKQSWKKLRDRRRPCPMCGSRKSGLIYKTANVHMRIFRKIFVERVESCRDCGFLFTNPVLSSKDLEKYYTDDYELEALPVPRTEEQFLDSSYQEIWFSKDRDLSLILNAKPEGKLLDVGCATGSLLWLARKQGYQVKGIEVGKNSARFAREVLKLDVISEQITEGNLPSEEFDVVTMFHSLEHIHDPCRTLCEIRRILKQDGVLIVVVPNAGGWSAQKDKERWRWLQPHNHYSHFTTKSLTEMALRAGFSSSVSTQEGRYGEEEIRMAYDEKGIKKVHQELRGSEVILIGHKYETAPVSWRENPLKVGR